MDMDSVIRVVETHSEKLSMRWLERVRQEGDMHGYLSQPEGSLHRHVQKAYEEISLYLDKPEHPFIKDHFRDTGRNRREMGVPLTQVVRAIQLARSVLWDYVLEQGIFDSTVNIYRALYFYRALVRLFDRAERHAIEGYMEDNKPHHSIPSD